MRDEIIGVLWILTKHLNRSRSLKF